MEIKKTRLIIDLLAISVVLVVAACVLCALYSGDKSIQERDVTEFKTRLESITAEQENTLKKLEEYKERISLLEQTIREKESEIAELNKKIEQENNSVTAQTVYQGNPLNELNAMINNGAPDTVIRYGDAGETTVRRPKVSLCYEDIETGRSFGFSENEVRFGASMVKAAYVTAILEEISEYEQSAAENNAGLYSGEYAKYDLNAPWIYDSATMFIDGSGKIRNKPDGFTTTTRGLIEFSILYSDNIAFFELQKIYGRSRFYRNTSSLGITGAESGFYNMSAKEAVIYMRELYRFTEENEKYGAFFKDLMSRASHKMMIPPKLRDAAIHKHGWDINSYCDMMIIYAPHPYIMCVMTDMDNGRSIDNAYIQSLVTKVDEIHRAYWSNSDSNS